MDQRQKEELRRLRRLLKQMHKVAEQASMTGALAEGAMELTARYNLILERLTTIGIETDNLFPPLPLDASLDRVGVACNLLMGYIEEDEEAGERNLAKIVIGNMSGLEDLDRLKDIGRLIRENIAEAFARPTPPAPPAPAEASAPMRPDDAPTQPRPAEPVSDAAIPMPAMERQNI